MIESNIFYLKKKLERVKRKGRVKWRCLWLSLDL